MAKQFTLGKNERLKSRKQTEHLFSSGKKFTLSPFRIYYSFNKSETPLLPSLTIGFGATVSSKIFKKAVDRNRVKRVIREAWRLQKSILQEKLAAQNKHMNIFFIYTDKELPAYKEVFEKIGKSINKLLGIINE